MRLMARQSAILTLAALAALAVAAASGCHASDGNHDGASTGPRPTVAASQVPTGAAGQAQASQVPTTGPAGSDASFCALARAKGAANLNVFDGESTTPAEERQVLTNIDDLTTAAPAVIHPDFVRFDTFEHALFAENGTPDPVLAQEAGGEGLRGALQNISDYLGQRCGIHA
ncbi:hypothetical protein [Pseudofrankia asymbiotica]|nr:hypothetical protein [Pseudofrankia asymbiotica]